MCGMWRILPVSCWQPLVGRFFSGCWKAWSSPALAEKDQIIFFFDHSWENVTFLKEDRSAGWEAKHPACDLSLLIRARPADMACASLLGQWDKAQLKREAGTVVVDSWYHSYCCPMSWGSQRGITYRQRLSEPSQSLLQGTRHTTSSSPPCNQKNCVTTSALYLPALDLNPEVKDFLYLLAISLSHAMEARAVPWISIFKEAERGGGGACRVYVFTRFILLASSSPRFFI